MNLIVGNKLRILRKDKNMSQEEVAEHLNISQSAYARMESGESSSWANHILRICKIFEISPEELLKIDINQKKMSSLDSVGQLSEKVIEQYEERIMELKRIIEDLKKGHKA